MEVPVKEEEQKQKVVSTSNHELLEVASKRTEDDTLELLSLLASVFHVSWKPSSKYNQSLHQSFAKSHLLRKRVGLSLYYVKLFLGFGTLSCKR